jgi:glutamine synthetase
MLRLGGLGHAFLPNGDVFTPGVNDTYLDYERTNEVDEPRLRPHRYAFFLYCDI